jgi:hypothetical protein
MAQYIRIAHFQAAYLLLAHTLLQFLMHNTCSGVEAHLGQVVHDQ